MDTLSEILRTVRLKGGIFLDARFTPSWSVASSITPDDLQPYMKQAEVLCALHYVISGEMYVEVEGEEPLLVKSGELVLLPRNTPHVLSNRPGQRPVPSGDLIQPGDNGGLASIVHGSGSGPLTNLVCGYLANEEMRNPLMATLPPMLKVNVSEGASRDWIESSVRYGAQQLSEGHHATSSVMARLSELLFVEAVRAYSETQEVHEQHWLHGLKDQYVGRALAARTTAWRMAGRWPTWQKWRACRAAPSSSASRRRWERRPCSIWPSRACCWPRSFWWSGRNPSARWRRPWAMTRKPPSTAPSSASSACRRPAGVTSRRRHSASSARPQSGIGPRISMP
ncbi:MAG: cupin domain-containing protein [Rhizobiales bacterium]|nr:cupin domain-containing protein [Hyphomicrobiales bacterium]